MNFKGSQIIAAILFVISTWAILAIFFHWIWNTLIVKFGISDVNHHESMALSALYLFYRANSLISKNAHISEKRTPQ